ncbi:MAG: fibronectin type III domain-containing protein, partial [Solirubrobacteraceae bacterium]
PTSGPNELVVGLYADSGFDDALMARMGFNGRVNASPTEDMELVAEDALTGATGATPSTSVQTGASTVWLLATVVLKPAPAAEPPAAPGVVLGPLVATPANRSATVAWKAPPNGGSPIATYTVTPYAGSRRLKPRTVSGTSAVIGGLRNGVRYRFRVAARNVLGAGPTSSFTNAVKPSAALVWAFWCTLLPMEAMHVGALDIYTPWAGEVLRRVH